MNTEASILKSAVSEGGPERWRVISVCCGGRHSLALALPDNERASLQSQHSSRRNSAHPVLLEDLPRGEPLSRGTRPRSAFNTDTNSETRQSHESTQNSGKVLSRHP